jgi:polysaccharide export outer membrane protein
LLDVFSNFDQRDADFTKVKLLRGDEVFPVDMEALLAGEVHMNYELEPGDYIVVPALVLPKAVIMGKVRIPGQYNFEEGIRLFDMVGMAGGFDERCDIKNIRVIRLNNGLLESIKCNLRSYQEDGDVTQNILIQHGDVIIVPEVGRPNWDKFFDSFSAINSITLWGRTNWW